MTADPVLPTLPALRLRGPVDLVLSVPYLLGFVPEASLVVVALAPDRTVAVVARIDLPASTPVDGLVAVARTAGTQLAEAAVRAGGRTAVAVVYPPDRAAQRPGTAVYRRFAADLVEASAAAGIEMIDVLLTGQGRWWSLVCPGSPCCPADGRTLPTTGTSAAEAAAVAAGLVALPNRAGVAARLAPAAEADRSAVVAELDAAEVDPSVAVQLVDVALADRLGGTSAALPPERAAELVRAVAHVQVRDAVSACRGTGAAAAAVSLWTDVVRLAPDGWLAGPAALLAAAAYQAGDGVLAGVAIDLALAEEPEHVLAGQLRRALDVGLPPRELRPVFELGSAAARANIAAMS